MAPEVRGSVLPDQPAPPDALPDNKPTPHPPRKPPHTPILKKFGPTTDEITESETVGQGTAIRNGEPNKVAILAMRPQSSKLSWIQGLKTFFMLNSAEHEILNAHKYKNNKEFSFFLLR